jgi:SAM-dependent methyltransferase
LKVPNPEKRLDSLWGLIDNQHNALIASKLERGPVLDVGCGYGSLVAHLAARGFDAVGIDPDAEVIRIARQRFPHAETRVLKAETLDEYPDRHFGAIVLKDALHHLTGEGDVDAGFLNFRRLLAENGRLVILDPNPMAILRLARRLAGHQDFEASRGVALKLLTDHGFIVRSTEFFEVLGLPLSGGYVGWRMVPNIHGINRCVASVNRFCSSAAVNLGLGPHVCWRYLIHAEMM